ncbi:MAG: ATP-dependent zinc protease [Polyangiales bacterium]
MAPDTYTTIGWREWVGLPELKTEWIKCKVDTGARSSSLHAFDIELFEHDCARWVRFEVHPWQGSAMDAVRVEAPLADLRTVKSSSGKSEERPVIRSLVVIAGQQHAIDITLTLRDEMGFRMLLGREALRRRFVVDPGSSYLAGRPPPAVREANRRVPDEGLLPGEDD